MPGYVLSIDCGTQSLRAIIFDAKGKMLAKSSVSFEPYYSTKPGFAEQDPYVYWHALCQTTKELKSVNLAIFDNVDVVSVTTQRDTCTCLDRDGEPVRDLISWADERVIAQPRVYSKRNQLALRAVGMFKVANLLSRQCHGHWVEDYEPENWAKTYKYVQLSGFLNHKLTSKFRDGVASQVGHIPFNYKKRIWEKPNSMKGQLFQLGMDRMIDLVETTGILGHVTKKASEETGLKIGLPVVAAGSDKGCETLGVGCNDNSTISISLGSQATVQASSEKYYEVQSFIPPFPGVNPERYNPEIQIYRGYWMISWFKNEFAHREQIQAEKEGVTPEYLLDKELKNIHPGSDGLILQPFWGAGLKSPEARGSIIGFYDYHKRILI
ncbi:MAG: FGGY-family carbohydrate kinase [Vallitaleaceae bacterium]|jgi:sugar (pentulose or hexulose) kinase|nr:FGGY-family carbohydrate kinase [Vallitaleaceae bacterium]